ncbi:MAG: class I SAM-dependent methyltransferase [Oscillospiraceae bacterium]|nr:class I SAM-dependent methyltransferase [Oscillospiraceae bacterium]
MRIADHWQDYELLDCSNGERLERWDKLLLIRPDPQVIWRGEAQALPQWRGAHAHYHRSSSGGGQWRQLRPLPEQWRIRYGGLSFCCKLMGFKHTGLFPEQAVNWALLQERIRAAKRPVKVLNLFAYTGGATLACLEAGAAVTHVDASRGMVQRAKENALASGLADRPVRWIVEDCVKFAQREIRRGNTYDILLLDPPSYGRGPNGEVWQLAAELDGFIALCARLLGRDALLLLLNTYSAEFSPAVSQYLLAKHLLPERGGGVTCDEIALPVTASGLALPCGSTAIWETGL